MTSPHALPPRPAPAWLPALGCAASGRYDLLRPFLVLDQGDGRRLGCVVYDSAAHARAAQQAITAAARESGVYEMMTEPQQGSFGTAIVADGIFEET
jgi:hypothetical protein